MTAHILVPLDGSASAESALPLETALARLTSSGLTLLRAIPSPDTYRHLMAEEATEPAVWDKWKEDLAAAGDYLDKKGKSIESAGVQVRTRVTEDFPVRAILDYAQQEPDVWLIALVARRLDPPRAWAYGNVMERVLNAATRPVLIVRPRLEGASEQISAEPIFRLIVVPLDGSRFAEEALGEARRLATLSGATLVLVSVVPPPDNRDIRRVEYRHMSGYVAREYEAVRLTRYLSLVAGRLRTEGLNVRTELAYGHPAEMILLTARRLHADLIVIASHGRRDLERVWLGSVGQRIVQNATLPVIVARPAGPQAIPAQVFATAGFEQLREYV